MVSGVMLRPDLESPITRIKLVLVLVLAVTRLIVWGASAALVSQSCWWGATFIGFLNRET